MEHFMEMMDCVGEDIMIETRSCPKTVDGNMIMQASYAACKIVNSAGRKTWLTTMVAAHVAAYGGVAIDIIRPEPLARILAGGQVVVYKGMIYSLDVWE